VPTVAASCLTRCEESVRVARFATLARGFLRSSVPTVVYELASE